MTLYRTVVADPPWAYQQDRALSTARNHPVTASHHYGTMTNEEIAAIPVGGWVEDDAHLYLWVTNPRLFGSRDEIGPIDIMESWGFEYRTLITWRKAGTLGMGFYFRGDTEHVLFGTRGRAPIDPAKRERNWLDAPKVGHSVKPDRFYEMVERVSPGPRLEMFARRRRFGWDAWGDEAPVEQASQAEFGLG